MCGGRSRKRPTGDARYHQYHIQDQLARIHPGSNADAVAPIPTLSKSSLQSLPTEILSQIFSYLLHSSTGIWIGGFATIGLDKGSKSTWFDFTNPYTLDKLYPASGLFLVSRRISTIALDVLYSLNEFRIRLDEETLLRSWLLSIGTENRNRITRLQLHGVMRTTPRELQKIGNSLQMMQRLRRIDYQPGSSNNRKVSTDTVEFDISADEIPQYSKTIMSMYTTKGLPATLRIIGTHPDASVFMEEQFQQRSRLLSLPKPILYKILSFCYTDDQVEISSPFNGSKDDRRYDPMTGSLTDYHLCCHYFQIFLVCKSLSRIMREIIYSSTAFTLQHQAFVVFSDVIRAEDFDRVTTLELVVGQPETERLFYNVQCLKAILNRLLRPSSNIRNLKIKMQRLCVPYLSIFRGLLMQLKAKCEIKLEESDQIHIDQIGVKFNDISWMLDADIDPNTTWAWGHSSKKWKNLPAIENDIAAHRRWKKVKKGGLWVGVVIAAPVGILILAPIICFSVLKEVVPDLRLKRRR
ncbi:hypothetical protein TWF718_001518 [Orbilia javanica]|uniref:Uncharacterized protein n=1 Tax=Orbilia javanica TaxID=47235 RepID=A0AAN8RH57_9PEZI